MMKRLQKLGKALMLPVATLPLAGLMLGIGYALDPSGWGAGNIVSAFLVKGGGAILDNLGIMFAVALGFGLTDDDGGPGALASLVSFLMMITLLSESSASMFANLLGYELNEVQLSAFAKATNGNVFFGIVAGIIGSYCYMRFRTVKLPAALSFFSGKRSVAIVTGGITIVVSAVLFFIWPVLFSVLVSIGTVATSAGVWGAGLYGFLNRLLIPTGLHHALNNVFWFDLIGINDLSNFWTNPDATGDVGLYMSGFFPIMMFGLPGAALAIYKNAKPSQKAVVGSLMGAAAICTFVTGATEPLEFSFMFVAPVLYLMHAILTGISMIVVGLLGARVGFNFSAGAIDYVLSLSAPHVNDAWMIIPIGLVFFAIYFFLFDFMIRKFDLKTPGRGDDDVEGESKLVLTNDNYAEVAAGILEGVGGKDNVTGIDHCTTRLRLEVKDYTLVDEKKIKASGGQGVVRPSQTSVQVIIGLQVQFVHDEFKKLAK